MSDTVGILQIVFLVTEESIPASVYSHIFSNCEIPYLKGTRSCLRPNLCLN